ncbi:MAG TPA: nitrilase-related carbon-nitrogen hydrolase, partial [Solirubrobacteraceae bacterium]
MTPKFATPYSHGFVRVASAVPHQRVGNPAFNVRRTLALAADADRAHAALVIFPELGLASYTSEDLFRQDALLDSVLEGLGRIVEASRELRPVIVVGAPLRAEGGLFNTAIIVHRGRILGVTPKSFIPEYREFYEKRQFRAARDLVRAELNLLGQTVPFGPDVIFACRDIPNFAVHVEICEDLWAAIPPSTDAALAGAT